MAAPEINVPFHRLNSFREVSQSASCFVYVHPSLSLQVCNSACVYKKCVTPIHVTNRQMGDADI
jgi:hypothetical protein